MTTATPQKPKGTPKKVAKPAAQTKVAAKTKKQLRIREEFLPDSARYVTIDDIEYIALPVADFGEWYEDVEDGAVVAYARQNPEPLIPAEKVHAEVKRRANGGKR